MENYFKLSQILQNKDLDENRKQGLSLFLVAAEGDSSKKLKLKTILASYRGTLSERVISEIYILPLLNNSGLESFPDPLLAFDYETGEYYLPKTLVA